MAIIVKSTSGYWVGKKLYNGQKYMSFDSEKFNHPTEKTKLPQLVELENDFKEFLGVQCLLNISDGILNLLARELCHGKYGAIYCIDDRAKYGVRKIIAPPLN